jgi:peroxiredoxin
MKRNNRLEFPVLTDARNAYARTLSLAYALPEDLREVYRAFGLDLPQYNGDGSWELPMPARLVVDSTGVLRGIDADPDYTRRPEPEETLELLSALAGRS